MSIMIRGGFPLGGLSTASDTLQGSVKASGSGPHTLLHYYDKVELPTKL